MGTLRVRTWRLCGANTKVRLMHHNKDSAGSVPDRVLPRIVGNCDAFRFANPVPAHPRPFQSTDSITDNSGQSHRKLRISLATVQAARPSSAPGRRNVLLSLGGGSVAISLNRIAGLHSAKAARQERRNRPANATLKGSAAFWLCRTCEPGCVTVRPHPRLRSSLQHEHMSAMRVIRPRGDSDGQRAPCRAARQSAVRT